jgi:hypothetical protein
METNNGGRLRIRRAALLGLWSGTVVLMALAPATAVADNPGNPGHHYGQISNPGHHYGQLKHPMTAPLPPPGGQPSPSVLHSQLGSQSTNQTIGGAIAIPASGSPLTQSALTGPVSAPAPQRNLWVTVILLALVLAANVAGGVVLLGRAVHFVLRRVRPLGITLPSRGHLQVEAV